MNLILFIKSEFVKWPTIITKSYGVPLKQQEIAFLTRVDFATKTTVSASINLNIAHLLNKLYTYINTVWHT